MLLTTVLLLAVFAAFFYMVVVRKLRFPPPLVVCSLTTIPERIERGTLEATLDSIQKQTVKPRITYLHVPRFSAKTNRAYDLDALTNILKKYNGKVQVNVIDRDLGPISKLVPVVPLLQSSDNFVFLVDDDVVYHPTTLETLVNFRNGKDAVGLAGRDSSLNFLTNVTRSRAVEFLETFAGALYSARILKSQGPSLEEFNDSLGSATCFCQDDIKIGTFLKMKNVTPFLIGKPKLSVHDARGTPQLRNENVIGTGNSECFDALKKRYNQKVWK
jgi:hypothetical protein